MKKITIILIVLFTQVAFSQVGVNTTSPDPSSMLDVSATDKGVLVPRVSLSNVTTTTLDGTNTAATGLLIWNSNAATVGGNGVGFYFFNGTQWMPITQTPTIDHDFYEVGTTNPPNSINDDIFKNGKVNIGEGSPLSINSKLTVMDSDNSLSTGLNVIRSHTNNTAFGHSGITQQAVISGSGRYNGVYVPLQSINSSTSTGIINNYSAVNNISRGNGIASNSLYYGIFNSNSGTSLSAKSYGTFIEYSSIVTSVGDKYGFFIDIDETIPATHYGVYSDVRKSSGYAGYFLGRSSFGTGITNRYLLPAVDGTAGQVMTTDGSGNITFQNVLGDGTGTDDQTIDNFSLSGTTLRLSLENDGQPLQTVNLASINTDDQNLLTPTLVGTTLNLNIENGTGTSIDLAPLQDGTGTDDQTIDNFSLSGTTLRLSLENDGQPLQTVNLASLVGTDDQNLVTPTLVGTTLNLNIENGTGTSIDLAPLQDGTGTDDQNIQNLAFNAVTNVLTVGIENGTSQTVNLSALATGGDIQGVIAGAGLTGGGTTGTVTVTAEANNGLNVDATADAIQLGGPLTENTTISQGTFSLDINLNGTGDFAIQDNGTDVFFVEDTGDIGIGTSNPAHPLHIVESDDATVNAVYIDKTDDSNTNTSSLFIQKTGAGSGRSHAIFTNVNGTGAGQKYGIFNNINSSANGNQYGTRNFINGATSSFIFGTFNNLDNAGTGNQYGVYNGMRGIAAANLYGTYNEFNSPSVTNETAGVYNSFSDGTPGAGGIMGVFSEFSNSNNGVYYGSRNSFTNAATGTGTKYGTYNLISATAGGTHYGTFNSVSVANGWAGYFLGRNYISDRLSIGITNNPNAALNINKNSNGTYAHIELTEAQSDDGARIRFNNSVETTNEWILYGRADNTNAESTFNIFNNVSGNVVVVNGEGRVGIMRVPVTNALEVNGTASKTVAGGFLANSDKRLKRNIATISPTEALKKILNLRGVTYYWNDDKTGTTRPENLQMGFIAQEIAEVFPEKVTEDNLGYLQTAYGDYDPIVFQAIKALNDKIENLEKENAVLKTMLEKINALEAKLDQMNIK